MFKQKIKKFLFSEEAYVVDSKKGLRSKVECATECYADYRCRTAVFQHDGDCHLVSNFTENLNVVEDNSNSPISNYVLEMKTKTAQSSSSTSNLVGFPIQSETLRLYKVKPSGYTK